MRTMSLVGDLEVCVLRDLFDPKMDRMMLMVKAKMLGRSAVLVWLWALQRKKVVMMKVQNKW